MDCHYCGEPANYHLDETEGEEVVPRNACYHCFQLLKSVEQEHRNAYLIEVLQKHHATAMLMQDTSEYKKHWLAKLADRISWAQVGFRVEQPKVAQKVAPIYPGVSTQSRAAAPVKSITPKPLKIKKLG